MAWRLGDILFFGELQARRPALELSFNSAIDFHNQSQLSGKELLETVFDAADVEQYLADLDDDPPNTTGLQLAEASLEASADIFAGALFLVFDDMIRGYASMVKASTKITNLQYGPKINGVPLGVVVAAAANNFRHASEWAELRSPYPDEKSATEKQKQQLASIRPLITALNLKYDIDGYVTRSVLYAIADSTGAGTLPYAGVEDLILDTVGEIALAHGWSESFTEARMRLLFRG